MTTNTSPTARVERAAAALHRRQAELRSLLQDAAAAAVRSSDAPAEVSDFKEAAELEAAVALRETGTEQALRELGDIDAALRRIREGSYGTCEACGEPIAPARLQAVPATALCAACQGARERLAAHRG